MRRLVVVTVTLALVLGTGATHAADEEAPAMGAFRPAGTMAQERAYHHAVPLEDGRVLIVGGDDSDTGRVSSIEVWDPATETFEPGGSLAVADGDAATLLADGRVLLIGTDGHAEVWDPDTNALTSAGDLPEAGEPTTALLRDGRVLVLDGGEDAVVWDPAANAFEPAGTPLWDRWEPTLTVLQDGRVLVTSSWNEPRAEVWDPTTNTFSRAGRLAQEQPGQHTATLLDDGRVLVIASADFDGGSPPSTQVWDPATNRFSTAGQPIERQSGYHTATRLDDGRVLVIGNLGSASVWDPATEGFEPAGMLARARAGFGEDGGEHSALKLADGRVMVTDGGTYCHPDVVEVWDPATEAFEPTGPVLEWRSDDSATPLADGRVLIVGGEDVASAEIWDPHVPAPTRTGPEAPAGPAYELGRRAAVSDLLFGVRGDLRGTCKPVGGQLPAGVVGAIDCRPGDGTVDRVRIHHYESQEALLDAYFARIAAQDIEPGSGFGCPEGPWLPTPACAVLELPERDVCFSDASKRARYIYTAPPFVLVEVVGRGRDSDALRDWAWRGSQDVPGSPTACCRGRKMGELHRELEASLSRPHACKAYWQSAVANDPFAYGAEAALNCGRLASEGFPRVAYMTLFRFPDAASMDEYWSYRRGQNPRMSTRAGACRDGKRGYGSWAHGDYFCYVSKSGGHALLRWTDERTNTYGVIDAKNAKLAPLYRSWLKLRP